MRMFLKADNALHGHLGLPTPQLFAMMGDSADETSTCCLDMVIMSDPEHGKYHGDKKVFMSVTTKTGKGYYPTQRMRNAAGMRR